MDSMRQDAWDGDVDSNEQTNGNGWSRGPELLSSRGCDMTVSHRKAKPAGGAYYIDGLLEAALQSPVESGTLAAEWLISGPTEMATCELLGITNQAWQGIVDVAVFQSLVQGRRPEGSGNDQCPGLVQNAGASTRVALHDFTLSSPKSVSVVWAFADPETRRLIEQAQARAARAFVSLLGHHATYSRQGRAGRIKTRCAVVAAMFPHFTSRSGDPQLHTHCTLLNLAVRPDGTTGSLETLQAMRLLGVAACTYHDELADGLRAIGFQIKERGQIFEVEGVSDAVCIAFSQRRVAALVAAQEHMGGSKADQLPALASRRIMKKAVLMTRGKKRLFLPDELMASWLRRGESLGFGPRDVLAIRRQRDQRVLPSSTLLEAPWEAASISRRKLPLILQQDHSGDRCNIKERFAT